MKYIFYFLIFLIIFVFVYDVCTRKFLNPYRLIMIFGKKGSGKTTFLTKVALDSIKKGKKVYSTVFIPGTILFDVNDIGVNTFPQNSVILIDEVGMIWDNRNFKDFKPNVRNYFKFQRQYKNTVYLFSQTFDVDLKLRNLTDEMYLLTNVARIFSVARRIEKNITIQHGTEGKPSTLADDYQFASIFSKRGILITFIPRYIDFFKSYDPTPLPFVSGNECAFTDNQLALVRTRDFIYLKAIKIINSLVDNAISYFKSKFKNVNKFKGRI